MATSDIREAANEGLTADRIASLLSARLFIQPQLTGGRLYFLSNLSGRLSLYAMDADGSVPEPLLPPELALPNPELVDGHSFHVLPVLDRIVVMMDRDGDELYEPFLIPIEGGFPEPVAETFKGYRSHLFELDPDAAIAYFASESREESMIYGFRCDLGTGEVDTLGRSMYGAFPVAWSPDHSRVILCDQYLLGDTVLYELDSTGNRTILHGTPLEDREDGRDYPRSGIRWSRFTASGNGLLLVTTLFDDSGAPGYLDLTERKEIEPVALEGAVHRGVGELERLQHLEGDRYAVIFNANRGKIHNPNLIYPGQVVSLPPG